MVSLLASPLEQNIAKNRVTNWYSQYAKIALLEALLQCAKTQIPGSVLVLNLLVQNMFCMYRSKKLAQPA